VAGAKMPPARGAGGWYGGWLRSARRGQLIARAGTCGGGALGEDAGGECEGCQGTLADG